jgi:hypothetical protein
MDDQQKKEGEAIRQLADDLYRERVLRARAMTGEEKLTMAAELSRDDREKVKVGLRLENPQADEATIQKLLVEHFNRLRQLDEASWISAQKPPQRQD